MRKTAEERFHTLARGWLAYPVTPIHSHLPPKSGCRNVIPRFANNLYNRSSAVDSLIHNQPQVGKPTWGYDYTTALRRLPLPSKNPPIIIGLRQRRNPKKTAEERFNMLARGWLAYPVTPMHRNYRRRAVVETSSWQNRDTDFLSIARKAEPEVAATVVWSVVVTNRHTTKPRNVIAAATTVHTAGTR